MATVATMPLKEMPQAIVQAEARLPELRAGGMAGIEQHPEWALLSRLPIRLSAGIPLPGFRVKDLLGVKVGNVVASSWPSSDDVPLKIGSVQLSWSEFEVVDQRMAIRLTRLA